MSWSLRAVGREFVLGGELGDVIVGRDLTAALRVDDDQVSRRHALIRIVDDVPTITDLRSRNGTYVNGQRIAGAVKLQAGDRIAFGTCEFELVQSTGEQVRSIEPDGVTRPMPNLEIGTTLPPGSPLSALSPRELEVFTLLARGTTQRAIAEHFGVSIKTIETHRTRIGQKLGLRTRADLIRYALDAGLLRAGQPG